MLVKRRLVTKALLLGTSIIASLILYQRLLYLIWRITQLSPTAEDFFFVKEEDLPYGYKLDSNDAGDSKLILNNLDETHELKLSGCPDYNCKISDLSLKQNKKSAAALVSKNAVYNKDFRHSKPIQLIVNQESPRHRHQNQMDRKATGWFNYHHNSSIWSPYGYMLKLTAQKTISHAEMMTKKRYLVAWFVSNCNTDSKRELYVKELSKYIPVDIYGSCGSKTCPKGDYCHTLLNQTYKFYLAFENSICDDYITEKFWHSIQQYLVPIVLKRSIVAPFAPAKSFIATDDYDSPEALAKYLLYLNETEEAYVEHHRWREHFRPIFLHGGREGIYNRPFGFCQLCKKLWLNTKSDWLESYRNSREAKGTEYCYDMNTSNFTISSVGHTFG